MPSVLRTELGAHDQEVGKEGRVEIRYQDEQDLGSFKTFNGRGKQGDNR